MRFLMFDELNGWQLVAVIALALGFLVAVLIIAGSGALAGAMFLLLLIALAVN